MGALKLRHFTIAGLVAIASVSAEEQPIVISTDSTKIELTVEKDGTLSEDGYGLLKDHLKRWDKTDELVHQYDFYPTYGSGYLGEPALQVTHADGDVTTKLAVTKVEQKPDSSDSNITTTEVQMKDSAKNLFVTLYLRAFQKQDLIQIWTKIDNQESGPVMLYRFASASPISFSKSYWLTQFTGRYGGEAGMIEEQMQPGMKVIGSNLGARAHRMRAPMFYISLNNRLQEESGSVIGSTLMWPGSYSFCFDMDTSRSLHMISGVNHPGNNYWLPKGQSIETPKTLWGFSAQGAGALTRQFHEWGRKYSIRDPQKPRPVLLNNWEATAMNFDENKIVSLLESAKGTGVDVFLLDDGWFGNKYPRDGDHQSLGDWDVCKRKLPQGLGYLCQEARRRGMEFGLWIEPEMISPKSELAEKHPDWALCPPDREAVLGRRQQVLDLPNPEIQSFVWNIFEKTIRANSIKYLKWDANCCIFQPYSNYLPKEAKGNLDFEYNKALLATMNKMAKELPGTMAMLCSGGGGRVDYASVANFHSFWPSDTTDPLHRVGIQWGFSYMFPPMLLSNHVTHMGKRPLKFSMDVAMSGALGFDLDFTKLPPDDISFIKEELQLYKNEIRPIVLTGEYYRLKSPYQNAQSAIQFVGPNQAKSVVFVYQVRDDNKNQTVNLRGLNPDKSYTIKEVSLRAGENPRIQNNGAMVTGRELMEKGLFVPTQKQCESSVILLKAAQ